MATSISKKRALTDFFSPTSKRVRNSPPPAADSSTDDTPTSYYPDLYPFPIPYLPPSISESVSSEVPASEAQSIANQPHLNLLYFQPFIPNSISKPLFNFLRSSLFFYRVHYTIKRGGTETQVSTPRFTTVFGVDETSYLSPLGEIFETTTTSSSSSKPKPIPHHSKYKTCKPRPLPQCLDELRKLTEVFTEAQYNICLVNYYASGADSISYHSDDEKFLGPQPCIASFSLGAQRDFLMKHKPLAAPSKTENEEIIKMREEIENVKPLKLALGSGDMVLMRGETQANWLHSIPKRKGGESERGRINITFRKAVMKGGTENFYRYNVGGGEVYKWDERAREMKVWR
ncbi:MAG: hypothetical protein Q9190_001425 [Brigantiaea leucoxantha]